jgi:hypothetical protein
LVSALKTFWKASRLTGQVRIETAAPKRNYDLNNATAMADTHKIDSKFETRHMPNVAVKD